MLEKILRIPHVPPDVGIIQVRVIHREDELDADQNQRENGKKGSASSEFASKSRSEVGVAQRVLGGQRRIRVRRVNLIRNAHLISPQGLPSLNYFSRAN